MIDNKTLLVTGGTGSFGSKFIKMVLLNHSPKKVIVFSRGEMKQWTMAEKFSKYSSSNNVEYVIGDVRDKERLNRVVSGVDIIVHAAATKIVPTAEYNPFECIKTNINGAMNVIEVALDHNVQDVVALSTDKACNPINLYGATKLASDKLFVSANLHSINSHTKFSVVRYGNVMGSRGSVIPFFNKVGISGTIPITDNEMTRFMISIDQAVNLVLHAINDATGGEIYVHKIPSMKITDIAKAIVPDAKQELVGIRPGEKIHEIMISSEDAMNTFEYDWYYKILPALNNWNKDKDRIKNGKKVSKDFVYASNNNEDWMSTEELKKYINSEDYLELQELNSL